MEFFLYDDYQVLKTPFLHVEVDFFYEQSKYKSD